MYEFELPDVGEGVAEGEIVSWLVEPGDPVEEDQPVAEVETDKAVVEVPSPVNGSVKGIHAEEGELVPVGTVIITFAEEGEEVDVETVDSDTEAAAETETDTGTEREADEASATAESEEVSTASGRVFAAPSARRLARELGVDISRIDGSGPGGRVSDADVRAAAEGTENETGGEAVEAAASPATAESVSEATTDAGSTTAAQASAADRADSTVRPSPVDRDRTLAAPATRKLADEAGIDIDTVPTDEKRDGEAFVTPETVQAYADSQQAAQEADAAAVAQAGEREERIPYRGIRRTIGQQMEHSKFTAPHVTHHDEVDVTELVAVRSELKGAAEERGISLSYMPFVMKACVAALREFPMVNAMLDEENEEIVQKNYYNIGVATATDAGLMVPVVGEAGEKNLLQLASEMNELVEKARERSISREEMQGGTFTLTNVGTIGGEYATPIVNHPEVAILALGAIKEKPRVVDSETPKASRNANGETVSGEIVPRHVMTLSLSFDHRVLDGAIAAQFTNRVEEYLEQPNRLLLE